MKLYKHGDLYKLRGAGEYLVSIFQDQEKLVNDAFYQYIYVMAEQEMDFSNTMIGNYIVPKGMIITAPVISLIKQ